MSSNVVSTPLRLDATTAIEVRQENPKKHGSRIFEKYERYKSAKTVAEALQLGATMPELYWDLSRGYLVITGHTHGADRPAAAIASNASRTVVKQCPVDGSPPRAARRTGERSRAFLPPSPTRRTGERPVPKRPSRVRPRSHKDGRGPSSRPARPNVFVRRPAVDRWFELQRLPNLGMKLQVGRCYLEAQLRKRCTSQATLDEYLLDAEFFIEVLEPCTSVLTKKRAASSGNKRESKRRAGVALAVAPTKTTLDERPTLATRGFARRSAGSLVKCIVACSTLSAR